METPTNLRAALGALTVAGEELDPIFGIVNAHLEAWTRSTEIDDSDPEAFEEAGRAADAGWRH